ncbi:MAG: FAD:protein FMN transferase, partial [Candidatus Omnitrophota bacterium]
MKTGLVFLIIGLILAGCAGPAPVQSTQLALGTSVEITVSDDDKPREVIRKAIDQAFAEIKRVENIFSRHIPESEISQINTSAGIHPVSVGEETIALLERSREFSELSNGAFDITVGPLLELWGFSAQFKGNIPPQEKILETLELVGYQQININKLENNVSFARPGMNLTMGGIGAGYAVDRAVAILQDAGIKNALVNAGGDIYALGRRNKDSRWRVAVQNPREKNAILTVLELENQAVTTSGDYQRYFEANGTRFSHIINPKTGYPCSNIPASVTVLAGDCTTADALATALFVL